MPRPDAGAGLHPRRKSQVIMNSDYRNDAEVVGEAEGARARDASAAGERPPRVDYDAELRLHNRRLRRAYGIRPHDHILDIGCGAGQTTRDAARSAVAGTVVGVDISAPLIERARRLTEAAGLDNVSFAQADAETHPFPAECFDVAISRFGTMFFRDPVAAFTNIARALRREGRLVMMVWQEHHRNEWSISIQRAIAGWPDAAPGALDPFSLGDPATTKRILDRAGFSEVTFTEVHEPVYYGPDVAAALLWVCGFSCVSDVLKRLDLDSAARIRERLEEVLAAHAKADGVWFDSRAWTVTAHRR
jgi:SAM-dependent methyltransferase